MCDTPRTDLDNVDSAYLDKQNAIVQKNYLNTTDGWDTWHVEELEVEE